MKMNWILVVWGLLAASVFADDDAWKKKKVQDFNDRDLEKLYEQWEEDEEPLPVDELPDWDPRKPRPGLDLSDMSKFQDADEIIKASKKGQSVMMFVKISGNPTKEEAEEISGIWQTGLWNSHISADRFMIEDDRALFLFKDGPLAWEGKDYFIEQERCLEVTLEQQTYHGYHTEEGKKQRAEKEAKKKQKKKAKKAKKTKTEL